MLEHVHFEFVSFLQRKAFVATRAIVVLEMVLDLVSLEDVNVGEATVTFVAGVLQVVLILALDGFVDLVILRLVRL